MIDLFNTHSIYWPIVIARENTTNENTNGTILRFKSTCNFYDNICDICDFQVNPDSNCLYHIKTTFLTLLATVRLRARHRTCWISSPPIWQLKDFRGCKDLTRKFWYNLIHLLLSPRLILVHNNFLLNWRIDCDENLTKSPWRNCLHNGNS